MPTTSNNLLYTKLVKRNVPNKRQGCLNQEATTG